MVKLHQVLTNLVSNALKFTSKGSVTMSCEVRASDLLFDVQDTGRGIAKDHCQRIFDRFYQVDTAMNRGYEGSGLGLPICRALVTLMGGDIWLESEVGKGTTFNFTMPLQKGSRSASRVSGEKPRESLEGVVVLIAEDDDSSYVFFEAMM